MRSRLPALLAVAILVALSLPAIAGARSAPSAADAAQAEHDRIVGYWTPQRMANATPREFARMEADRIVPLARPGTGGGGVTGASWGGGGEVVERTGKVFFHMGAGDWICSGSIINDNNDQDFSIVLTAGHCTVDETTGEFATNWLFYPSFDTSPTYDCDANTFGCWTAVSLVARYEFVHAGGFTYEATRHDWGFAVVGAGGADNTQLDALGSYTLDTSEPASPVGTTMWAFGYPAAGKYHGYDLTYCTGKVGYDSNNDNLTYSMPCNMTGGSSGGPWFSNTDATKLVNGDAATRVRSLNSYGYSRVKNMYGPFFNSETAATFNAALSADGSEYEVVVGP